jgi:hypothetical protein
MALRLDDVAFDCADPRKVAAFWAGALDHVVHDDGPPDPDEDVADVVSLVEADGTSVHRSVEEGGSFWTVMQDVEGNEFCVLRGPGDGWTPEGS